MALAIDLSIVVSLKSWYELGSQGNLDELIELMWNIINVSLPSRFHNFTDLTWRYARKETFHKCRGLAIYVIALGLEWVGLLSFNRSDAFMACERRRGRARCLSRCCTACRQSRENDRRWTGGSCPLRTVILPSGAISDISCAS